LDEAADDVPCSVENRFPAKGQAAGQFQRHPDPSSGIIAGEASFPRTGTTAEGSMTVSDEHSQVQERPQGDRVDAPDVLPKLQSLLAILADIDIAYESNLLAIESRPMDAACKARLITDLRQIHCKQRAPYLWEIGALQKRMEAAFY
jgi:hypothetical protein